MPPPVPPPAASRYRVGLSRPSRRPAYWSAMATTPASRGGAPLVPPVDCHPPPPAHARPPPAPGVTAPHERSAAPRRAHADVGDAAGAVHRGLDAVLPVR